MENLSAGGCVVGSQSKFLAVRKADGSYELRDGLSMKPAPVWRVVADEDAVILYTDEPKVGPRIPSKIDVALARVKAGAFKTAIERERKVSASKLPKACPMA